MMMLSEPPSWEAWRIDPAESLGSRASAPCRWAALLAGGGAITAPPAPVPGLGLPLAARAAWNGSLCLRPEGDLLSDHVVREGRWFECDDLVPLLAIGALAAGPGAVALDVGANLGACTMQLLLSTDAPVVAFEPGAANLGLLSASVGALALRHPPVRRRAVLLPLALGDANSSFFLHPALGTAGRSVACASFTRPSTRPRHVRRQRRPLRPRLERERRVSQPVGRLLVWQRGAGGGAAGERTPPEAPE